jgi:hypothetical protein
VIAKVESALKEAMEETTVRINEFTVAPQITPPADCLIMNGIEFENEPDDIVTFAEAIDDAMRSKQNMYYDDLIVGNILRKLVITKVTKNGFQDYMKSIGKLGDKIRS